MNSLSLSSGIVPLRIKSYRTLLRRYFWKHFLIDRSVLFTPLQGHLLIESWYTLCLHSNLESCSCRQQPGYPSPRNEHRQCSLFLLGLLRAISTYLKSASFPVEKRRANTERRRPLMSSTGEPWSVASSPWWGSRSGPGWTGTSRRRATTAMMSFSGRMNFKISN